MPKPLDPGPYAVRGADTVARYLLDVLRPPWPLEVEQLVVLAAFLIAESSRILDPVGLMPWFQIVRPGELASPPVSVECYTQQVQPLVAEMQGLMHKALSGPLQVPPVGT